MWPFKTRKLKDRYSKLVKLIMSIDSHFQITEDEEKSVRLHLPNYKGNQPMDFDIYLMEPQLHISFVTEIEGEKISVLSYFDQYADQQDMFNAAMAKNLNKMHNVMKKKYGEELEKKGNTDNNEQKESNNYEAPQANRYRLDDFFDYDESYKKHILTIMMLRPGHKFRYYSNDDATAPLWLYSGNLSCDQDKIMNGAAAYIWILQHYEQKEDFCYLLDFLGLDCMGKEYLDMFAATAYKDAEEMINDIKRYVPSFKLGNDPQEVQPIIHQTWMDVIAINNFISYCANSLTNIKVSEQEVKPLHECSSIEDLALLFLSEFKVKTGNQIWKKTEEDTLLQEDIKEPTIVKSWSLLDFAKQHGKMKVVPGITQINHKTGEEYKGTCCAFIHPTEKDEQGRSKVIFVAFSPDLGELTPAEITAQKNDLIVVEYASGNYALNRNKTTTKDVFISSDSFCIKQGTKSIGYSEYKNRIDLTSVIIPEGVTSIGDFAFEGCSCLSFIIIPDSVKTIGWGAFKDCTSLTSITIPSNVTRLGNEVFSGCYKLASITIPSSVISIGKGALTNTLWYDKQPKGLVYAGKMVYKYKGEIADNEKIVIRDGTLGIADFAFYRCVELISINIPRSIKCIGSSAFSGCKELTSIIIPNGVTSIGDDAFRGCDSLTNIFIPSSVINIGHFPFSASRITSIIVESGNPKYDSRNNCNALIETQSNTLIVGCKNTIIPIGVTNIGRYAFEGCGELKSLTIPSTVVSIGDSAFYHCYNLTAITIPQSVQFIEQGAFRSCRSLTSVSLPIGIEQIGSYVFDDCENLKSILIPSGSREKFEQLLPNFKDKLAEIEDTQEVDLAEGKEPHIQEISGEYYSSDGKCLISLENNDITSYEIREGTELIGELAFSRSKMLSNITIPQSVLDFEPYAFAGCKNLKSIFLSLKMTYLPVGAFAGCENLESILIHQGIERIEDYAFKGCKNLKKVILPPSLSSLGKGVFDDCRMLRSLFIPTGSRENFKYILSEYSQFVKEYKDTNDLDVKILDTILSCVKDEYGVAYNKEGSSVLWCSLKDLTTYSIRYNTKVIGSDAFKANLDNIEECKSLKGLILPETIEYIGGGAFANNKELEYINIPQNVGTIDGDNPFAGCCNLKKIKWDTPHYVKEGCLVFDKKHKELIACLCEHYIDIDNMKESIPLIDFARMHGKMQMGYWDKNDAQNMNNNCVFIAPDGAKTIVAIHKSLSKISPKEIVARKNELLVVQYKSGEFVLCPKEQVMIVPDRVVSLPEGLNKIAGKAFYGNQTLTVIAFPKSLTEIGEDAFEGCTSLKEIIVPDGTISRFETLLPKFKGIITEENILEDDLPF